MSEQETLQERLRRDAGYMVSLYHTSAANFREAATEIDRLNGALHGIAGGDANYFAWLIEAPGQRYLAVQRLHMSDNFEWTADHNKALAFKSREQADALMMAVRQMDRGINGFDKGLFAFEATLGNAAAVEHGWLPPSPSEIK